MLEKGTLFDPVLVSDLINKVKGHSSLATLAKQTPIPFNGQKEFIFSMENEVDIVAESGKKSHGGVKIDPITIMPIKVEYGARVTDEFIFAAEETQIEILKAFNDGFSRKLARGLDLMAMHGVNPRTGKASDVIQTNHFDGKVTQTVDFTEEDPDNNIEAAVAVIQGADGEVSGISMSPVFSGALAKLKVSGVKQFPELAWGANPDTINGLDVDVNKTVSEGTENKDRAIIGDFANSFRWGYAKNIPLEVIQYGDPDGSGFDLKNYNQVYLRTEAYIGWGILRPECFARIVEASEVGG